MTIGSLQGLDPGLLQNLLCILHNIQGTYNPPYLKPSFEGRVVYLGVLYAVLGLSAVAANGLFLYKVVKLKRYSSYIFAYLGLLCLVNLTAALTVLPLSFLTQVTYWDYGSLLCHNMPLIQELFANIALLTPAMLAIERYREIRLETNQVWPVWLGFGACLLVSACGAFPGSFFITFFSTKESLGMEDDVQMCVVHTEQMEEYARAMLVLLYAAPLLTVAFCFAKVSVLLQNDSEEETGSKIEMERCTQRILSLIVLFTALCWLPLNISSVVQFTVVEDCDFTKLNLLYCAFVWVSFGHAIVTPLLGIRLIGKRGCFNSVSYSGLLSSSRLPSGIESYGGQVTQTTEQ